MNLRIVQGDITKITCDAIVNAANSSLLGGGGVDGAIHKAAGKGLLLECMTLGGCKVGQAKVTKGHRLPCKHIIHTVGPKWKGGNNGEEELLRSCYRECVRLAVEHECKSIAFPLISAGVYGYPKEKALSVAVDTLGISAQEHDLNVTIVLFDQESIGIAKQLFSELFIEDQK